MGCRGYEPTYKVSLTLKVTTPRIPLRKSPPNRIPLHIKGGLISVTIVIWVWGRGRSLVSAKVCAETGPNMMGNVTWACATLPIPVGLRLKEIQCHAPMLCVMYLM